MIWEQNKPRELHVANVYPGVQTSGCIVWTQFNVQATGPSVGEGVTLWKMTQQYCI